MLSSAINHRLGGGTSLGEAIEKAFSFVVKREFLQKGTEMNVDKLKELYWDEVTEHLRRTMNKQYNDLAALKSNDHHYKDSEMAMHSNSHYDPIRVVHEDDVSNMAEPELRNRLARRLNSIADKLNNGDAAGAYEELYGETAKNWLAPSVKKLAEVELRR